MRSRRRIHFVQKRFQAVFIATFIVVAATGIAVAAFLIDAGVRDALKASMFRMRIVVATTGEVIAPVLWRVVPGVVAGFVGVVSVVAMIVLRAVSKDLARLEADLQAAADGNVPGRSSGVRGIPGIAPAFDAAMEALAARAARDRAAVRASRSAVAALDACPDPASSEAIERVDGALAALRGIA